MNIVLITQAEPFYLSINIQYLIKNLPPHSNIVGCVLLSASPYGRRKSFLGKAKETWKVFGNKFFIYYSFRYLASKFNSANDIVNILKKNKIPPIFLEKGINSNESLEIIKQFKPDILISILGNEIFKKKLIELAPKGCLNLHTSLLPEYRGLMPTFWVLKNNEKKTGVSVFFVDEGIDSGTILVQKEYLIKDGCTQSQLIRETKELGMKAIIEGVDIIHNNTILPITNDDKFATYYSMPTRKDVEAFLNSGKKFF